MTRTGFQSMMTFWERWHAVNAVQLAELSQDIEIGRLRNAVVKTLHKLESTHSGGQWRLNYGNTVTNFSEVVSQHPETLHSEPEFEAFVSSEMNREFHDHELPIRAGVLIRHERSILWICYRHSIADARSIAMLMQHLLEELTTESGADLEMRIEAHRCEDTSQLQRNRMGLVPGIAAAARSLAGLQKCSRRRPRGAGQFEMSFLLHGENLPVAALRQRAAAYDATVGELMTACLLDWLHRIDGPASNGRSSARSVSVLADLASRTDPAARTAFSQNICPFTVLDPVANASLEERIGTVQKQMRGEQNLLAARQNLNGMLWNSQLLKLLPRPLALINQEFLFPIGGAVSNVNLNSMLLPDRTETAVRTYWRSTCATQFCPVIVCLTTYGSRCTITSTHLDSYYSTSEIRGFGQTLLAQLFDANSRPFMREIRATEVSFPVFTGAAS